MYLSIVSPVYRAAEIVEKLVSEIHLSVKTITDDYEIILVEDGSPDQSRDRSASAENRRRRHRAQASGETL